MRNALAYQCLCYLITVVELSFQKEAADATWLKD